MHVSLAFESPKTFAKVANSSFALLCFSQKQRGPQAADSTYSYVNDSYNL